MVLETSAQLAMDFPPRAESYFKKLTFEEPFRLEIAAGNRPTDGFVHHDIRELEDIEIVCDCRKLPDFLGTKAAEIRATHILEHFSWRETSTILNEWGNLLHEDGFIYIEVPNFLGQMRALASGEMTHKEVVSLAYGDQDYEGNYHKNGFTEMTLAESLWSAGFRSIMIRDIGLVLIASAVWKNEPEDDPSQVVYSGGGS